MQEVNNQLGSIFPTIGVYAKQLKEVEQRKHYHRPLRQRRKNNRKNTKSRHTQYVKCIDDSVFPPKLYVKCIKHKSK